MWLDSLIGYLNENTWLVILISIFNNVLPLIIVKLTKTTKDDEVLNKIASKVIELLKNLK